MPQAYSLFEGSRKNRAVKTKINLPQTAAFQYTQYSFILNISIFVPAEVRRNTVTVLSSFPPQCTTPATVSSYSTLPVFRSFPIQCAASVRVFSYFPPNYTASAAASSFQKIPAASVTVFSKIYRTLRSFQLLKFNSKFVHVSNKISQPITIK